MATQNIYNLTDTWNDGATTFNAIKMNVTDAGSASNSLLMDLQIGGTSKLRVFKSGLLNINDTTAYVTAGPSYSSGIHIGSNVINTVPVSIQQGYGISLKSDVSLRWCQSAVNTIADIALTRDSAGVLKITDGSTGDGQLKVGRITTTDTRLDTTATELNFALSGLPVVGIGLQYLGLNQNSDIRWSNSTTDPTSSGDIGLTRDSAGVLKVTDGSTGDGQLKAGSVTTSTYGSSASPVLSIGTTNVGFYRSADTIYYVTAGPAHRFGFGNQGVELTPVGSISWSGTSAQANQAKDTGIARDSAGVIKITDGSTGYGHLIVDTVRVNNPINTQTGVLFTPAVSDAERYIRLNNSAAITVSVPSDATSNIPVGTTITFEQTGTGTVTFVAGSGATLNSRDSLSSTVGQYSVASLIKTAANTFTLTGDLV